MNKIGIILASLMITVCFQMGILWESCLDVTHAAENDLLKVDDFYAPNNNEVEWHIDNLHRVGARISSVTRKNKGYSVSEVKCLISALENPSKYVAAHIMLSQIFGYEYDYFVKPVNNGFEIDYHRLKVHVEYNLLGGVVEEEIRYSYPENQQSVLKFKWDEVELDRYSEIVETMASNRRWDSGKLWSDNKTYGLPGLSNDQVKWVYATFGYAHPLLLNSHGDDIAENNLAYADELVRNLKEESKFVAAHVALTCIYGETQYLSVRGRNGGYEVYLNGLHVIVRTTSEGNIVEYPRIRMQRAWLEYQWRISKDRKKTS